MQDKIQLKIDYIRLEIECLGEVRMGSYGWGVKIYTNEEINILSNESVFLSGEDINKAELEKSITHSDNFRYLVIEGWFSTYVLDTESNSISLYKTTLHDRDGIWCEEIPIWYGPRIHFNTVRNKHYYIQFPFIPHKDFEKELSKYTSLRIEQINAMKSRPA